ncbi:MAG: hypothetical protein ABI995_01575 [Acidobacteriota bacterium]
MAGQTKSAFFDVLPVTCTTGYTVSRIQTLPVRYTPEGSIHPDQPKGIPGDVYYGVSASRGCIWTAVSNSAWVQIIEMCRNAVWDPFCDQTVGSGSGYFHYRWDTTRAGTAQTGSISVAGQTLPVGPPDSQELIWIQSVGPATGVPGPAAPGSLLTVFGSGFCSGSRFSATTAPWPTNAAGVTLAIRKTDFGRTAVGTPALHYVGPSGSGCQINAQLPWDVQPGTYFISIDYRSFRLWTGTIDVVPLRPAFYSAPPGYPVLLQIADRGYGLMTAALPAYPGETLVGYPDGFGQTSPPRATGQAANVGPGQFARVNALVQASLKSCAGPACSSAPVAVVYAIAYPASPAAYQVAFTLPSFVVDRNRQYSLLVNVGVVAAPQMPLSIAPRP